MVKAQEWLDREYPKWEYTTNWERKKVDNKRSKIKEIYLNEPSLEGELDLADFTYEWRGYSGKNYGVKVYISSPVDETKLTLKNLPKYGEIIKCIEAQKWLDKNYPLKGTCVRKEWKWDDREWKYKEVDHRDFGKARSEITELDISSQDLEGNLNLNDFPNLKKLDLSNNKLLNQDLINEFGHCQKCFEINTSKNWCQPCAEKGWKQDLEQPTETEKTAAQKITSWFRKKVLKSPPELIEKFIQQQKERDKYREKLKWIPYQQFTNIKQIGEGGFSKIYKAEWRKYLWSEDKTVVLKSLNNSQNITPEFLTEITNAKLVNEYSNSNVVKCYGISQDPETKNYVMIMEYMRDGDLRQFLQNKNSELNLKDKLGRLKYIADGLFAIHNQNLVHRDFHSGNILNNWSRCYISDLGLFYPANYQKQDGKIFGVLPYVAPEVLQGGKCTQKSDIYSFGIIAYELLANEYPYPKTNDMGLSLKVCSGYRPNIDKIPIPQEVKDLIKRCWDTDPEKRSSVGELCEIINSFEGWWGQEWLYNWFNGWKNEYKIRSEYQALEQEYNLFSQKPYQMHSTATTTSKMIDTKQITKLLESYQASKNLELDINDFDLDELNLQEDPQEQSSLQAQVEIPPKNS